MSHQMNWHIVTGRSRCSSDIRALLHRRIQIPCSRPNGPSYKSHFQRLQRFPVSFPAFNSLHESTQHPAQLGIIWDRVHHYPLRTFGMAQSCIVDSAGSHFGNCVDWGGGFSQSHCDDSDWDNVHIESCDPHLYPAGWQEIDRFLPPLDREETWDESPFGEPERR